MLGSYQLLAPIGVGGMGRVWVARETRIIPGTGKWRLVAVKTALAEDGASHDFFRTLFDEARIASLLTHPNVCTIHVVEKERGVDYLVMDYSDGASLRELLDALPDKKMDAHVAARIVARVCSGLQAAHDLVGEDGEALGVVHRDVSPQNVLIAANGQVRITDFGVAKARGQLHAPTQTGEVKGKIAYMAPEQVTTKDIDRRVDVFAIGCVLYEATVGQRPFHGGDALSTLYQLLEEPIVPPSARAENYPPELEAIVLKAMERDREARYPSAAEFGRALERWLIAEKATVTDADVAAALRSAMGDHVDKLREKIETAITAIESGKADSLPPPPDEEPLTLVQAMATPQGGRTLGGASLPDIETKRSRSGLLLVIGGLAAAIAVGAVLFTGRSNEPPVSKLPDPVATSKTTEPATPPFTAGATVATPVSTGDPAPEAGVSAEPAASITPLTLRPGVGRRNPRAPTPGPTAATGAPTTTTTSTPNPTGARPLDGPTPVRKQRVLDADNPFAPK
jgi:eukaryotic-like serine/threonine-protein kinase